MTFRSRWIFLIILFQLTTMAVAHSAEKAQSEKMGPLRVALAYNDKSRVLVEFDLDDPKGTFNYAICHLSHRQSLADINKFNFSRLGDDQCQFVSEQPIPKAMMIEFDRFFQQELGRQIRFAHLVMRAGAMRALSVAGFTFLNALGVWLTASPHFYSTLVVTPRRALTLSRTVPIPLLVMAVIGLWGTYAIFKQFRVHVKNPVEDLEHLDVDLFPSGKNHEVQFLNRIEMLALVSGLDETVDQLILRRATGGDPYYGLDKIIGLPRPALPKRMQK